MPYAFVQDVPANEELYRQIKGRLGDEPPKGLVIVVKDRPEVLRTFMPDAGAKAIAVGYPGYVSLAFSADQCRTAYAWGGNFLDSSPVWNNRGGAPAKLLGQNSGPRRRATRGG